MKCAGSAAMQAPYLIPENQPYNDAAMEGTAAHWVAASLASGDNVMLGITSPNGMIVDSDMIFHAEEYVEILKGWKLDLVIEKTIPIQIINNEGTPDVFAIDTTNKLLKICDYKYGFNSVDVATNWQLLCYAHATISTRNLWQFDVEFSIFQPRSYSVEGTYRTVRYSSDELSILFEELRQGANLAMSDNPPIKTGKQCNNCEARHVCVALQESSYIAVEISQEMNRHELTILQSGNELIRIEQAIDVLKARKNGLEAQIKHGLLQGEASHHFKIDRVKSREKWQEGRDGNIIEIGKMLGQDFSSPVKALTPAQCRKLKLDEDIIKAHSVTPLGEAKLVRVNLNETKKLFGK